MQVAGVDAGFTDGFSVEFEDEAQDAVSRGVDWTHVDDDALRGDLLDLVEDVRPVSSLGHDLGDLIGVEGGT